MTPPITATAPRTLGCCVACLTGQTHTDHDRALPAAQRSSITAPTTTTRPPALHEYLPFPGESDHYPSV